MTRFQFEVKEQGISIRQFHESLKQNGCDVHYETVRRWDAKGIQIPSEHAMLVARLLGITTDDLLAPFDIIRA